MDICDGKATLKSSEQVSISNISLLSKRCVAHQEIFVQAAISRFHHQLSNEFFFLASRLHKTAVFFLLKEFH